MRLPHAVCTLASAGALVAVGLTSTDTGAGTSSAGPPGAVPIKVGIEVGPASTCTTGGRIVCLTARAGGRTVAVTVGSRVEVDLSSPDSSWSGLAQAGPQLLQAIGAPRRHSGGVEAAYRAVKPGHTVMRAFERPVCAPSRACPQFIRLWEVSIRVHRP